MVCNTDPKDRNEHIVNRILVQLPAYSLNRLYHGFFVLVRHTKAKHIRLVPAICKMFKVLCQVDQNARKIPQQAVCLRKTG